MQISRDCFCEFCPGLSHDIRASVSRECRENFHVSRTSRELVAKVLNMFMRFFFRQNISQNCRATVVRRSCECREPVVAKFWRIYKRNFRDTRMNVVRVSHDGRVTLEKSCEYLATIWRENKSKRHSYECRATRMSRDCRMN